MNRVIRHGLVLVIAVLGGCGGGGGGGGETAPPPAANEFRNPQLVSILGYQGDAMEPALSRDGQYLFFNNLNIPEVDTNLHWAERIDASTFQYKGELAGANTPALDAVASIDRNGELYFVSTRNYSAPEFGTLYRGHFAAGAVSNVEPVMGVSERRAGRVNFDVEISADGETLYSVESQFANGAPLTADIVVAKRSDKGFVRLAESAAIMQQINTAALEYAVAVSTSGLEIFFTRAVGQQPVIYTAQRSSTSEAFGAPRPVAAITGFAEAATLSPDEKSLYYHKKDGGVFRIYRVTR